jgi:hypothetical protein
MKQSRPGRAIRDYFTIIGFGLSLVAVASLLILNLTWISASVSQYLGVSPIKALSQFVFWSTVAGLLFSAVGSGRKRFLAVASCLVTGFVWFGLAMSAAISMATPLVRHSSKFLIPVNYVGWVAVKYGEAKAPALQTKDGVLIYRIPPDGNLATSSALEQGWGEDEYFYYAQDGSTQRLHDTGWGKGGMIWGGTDEWQQSQSESASEQVTAYFYVGTEDMYRHAVSINEKRPFDESIRH